MKVEIKNLNSDFELKYQTKGSAGIDLCSIEDICIKPNSFEFVNLGVVVKTPKDHMTLLVPRSSLFFKKRLILANSVGIIDSDYSGDDDIIKACLFNLGQDVVEIKKNERICQIIFVKISNPEIELVETMNEESRGGFGSTGNF